MLFSCNEAQGRAIPFWRGLVAAIHELVNRGENPLERFGSSWQQEFYNSYRHPPESGG
jgi:hypothetical protein